MASKPTKPTKNPGILVEPKQPAEPNKPQETKPFKPPQVATETTVLKTTTLKTKVVPTKPADNYLNPENTYPTFSGLEFKKLFEEIELINVEPLALEPPAITGDLLKDEKIRQIAENWGYRRWPAAKFQKLVRVEKNHRLQPEVASNYLNLKAAAAAAGHNLWLVSGFRSYDHQRQIFNSYLKKIDQTQSDSEKLTKYYSGDQSRVTLSTTLATL